MYYRVLVKYWVKVAARKCDIPQNGHKPAVNDMGMMPFVHVVMVTCVLCTGVYYEDLFLLFISKMILDAVASGAYRSVSLLGSFYLL